MESEVKSSPCSFSVNLSEWEFVGRTRTPKDFWTTTESPTCSSLLTKCSTILSLNSCLSCFLVVSTSRCGFCWIDSKVEGCSCPSSRTSPTTSSILRAKGKINRIINEGIGQRSDKNESSLIIDGGGDLFSRSFVSPIVGLLCSEIRTTSSSTFLATSKWSLLLSSNMLSLLDKTRLWSLSRGSCSTMFSSWLSRDKR